MEKARSSGLKRYLGIGIVLVLWAIAIWLLLPLLTIEAEKAAHFFKSGGYFSRAATGIIIMIILLGKTATDLFFPLDISRKRAVLSSIFLILYSIALLSAIIFMILRAASLYIDASAASSTTQIQY